MTCKDCIHCEACERMISDTSKMFKVLLSEILKMNCDIKYDSTNILSGAEICQCFQDRARFVELPCKVGDTVYMLTEQTQKLGRKKITKTVIVECCVDNFRIGDAGYPSAALCDNENVWCYGVEPKMFGEIIFLSRETAEQALKERGGND